MVEGLHNAVDISVVIPSHRMVREEEMLRRLRVLVESSRELEQKLVDVEGLLSSGLGVVLSMKEISEKVGKVFVLYRELVSATESLRTVRSQPSSTE